MTAEDGFEAVARRLLPTLYRVARGFTGDASEAEDLVGQTLLSAAKGWNGFDGRFPKTWMVKIMRNQHIQNRERQASRPQTTAIDEGAELSDGKDVWREEDARLVRDRVVDELRKLPDEYRLAVVLCDVEQLDYAQAAESLGVPIGTLRSRLHRGRHALRQRLAHFVGEPA